MLSIVVCSNAGWAALVCSGALACPACNPSLRSSAARDISSDLPPQEEYQCSCRESQHCDHWCLCICPVATGSTIPRARLLEIMVITLGTEQTVAPVRARDAARRTVHVAARVLAVTRIKLCPLRGRWLSGASSPS